MFVRGKMRIIKGKLRAAEDRKMSGAQQDKPTLDRDRHDKTAMRKVLVDYLLDPNAQDPPAKEARLEQLRGGRGEEVHVQEEQPVDSTYFSLKNENKSAKDGSD